MIDEIQVQNLALIRDGSLAPSRGLTVLTGETGAGKTALLSAMKLLIGARASSDAVRDGQPELTVSGRFYGLRPQGDGQADESDELVVSRKVTADGRSRAKIDGAMVSVHELAQAVGPSVDLCGQFEHQRLMRAGSHVAMLDRWAAASVEGPRQAYEAAFDGAQEAQRQLQQVRESQALSAAKLDEARFTLARIDEVAPQPGEYEELQQHLKVAEHAESLARAASEARAALSDDGGALDSLNRAASALEAAAGVDDKLASLAEVLREAGYSLEDVSAEARGYLDAMEFDPAELQFQQERFSQLAGLLRTYGPRMEDVLERREKAAQLIALVDDYDESLAQAERVASQAEQSLAEAADALDAARDQARPPFQEAVNAVMDRLQMGGAHLKCESERLPRDQWTQTGPSRFEFMYAPVADGRPRPLTRIASGGEVSRVMLALKAVLGEADDVDTLVFDEVDAGVGGAVALALAEVIADLARTHQVIVVTHLAQVAVQGDTHYVVTRTGDETAITPVAGEDREREIARMLGGTITDASLAHAKELLAR